MQRLMKCWARGALGLGAAALLLSGIPAHAQGASGAPDATGRDSQPRLMAQNTAQPAEAQQLEKRRLEEQKKKAAMENQQQQRQRSQPRRMETRGPIPEAAPGAPASRGRFGAGVVRDKQTGDAE
jgi:hypothetical protein